LVTFLGALSSVANAQDPQIVLNNATDATAPLYNNGSISAAVYHGSPPYNYTVSNTQTGQSIASGQLAGAISGLTLLGAFESHAYYRANSQYASYNTASNAAAAHGGYLASITSAAEQNWLFSNGGWQAGDHLGASDQNSEGTWVWDSGEPFSYTNWSPGEPNNGNGSNQDYMQIYNNGLWDDVGFNHNANVRVLMEIPCDINLSNLLPGSYEIQVSDFNGREDTYAFEIGPGVSIFNSSVYNTSCPGGDDGQVVVNVEGGVPPYTYEWSTGQSGSLPQPIEGFDLLGEFGDKIYYLSNEGFSSYDEAAELADTYLGYIASVNSAAENNWLINTGGWPAGVLVGGTDRDSEGTWTWDSGEPFSYSNWSGGEPNDFGSGEDYLQILNGGAWNDIPWSPSRQVLFELAFFASGENLAVGEHTLTITDSNGNQVSQTFTVGDPEPFSVEFDMTPVSGCGANGDGTVVADVDGGTGSYTYLWETGSTSNAISGLDVGFYTLTTTDSNGCVFVADANVIAGDTDGPTVIAQDITVELDTEGFGSLSPEQVNNGTFDDCDEAPELMLSRRVVIPISDGDDDVEEDNWGSVYFDSSDLEFFYDGEANGGVQVIGLRFQNIDLPAGTIINNAYIQFFTEDANLDGAAPEAIIEIEHTADAGFYSWGDNNVSNRNYIDEVVNWQMPVWNVTAVNGADQRTPDLSSLLQQVINLEGWQEGNSVAFMMSSPDPILSDLGNKAATYEENPLNAPRLVIDFAAPQTDFSCSDLGERIGYLTAVDDAGNVGMSSFNLNVVDVTAPEITTQNRTVYLDENGQAATTEEELITAIADACSNIEVGGQTLFYEVTSDDDDVEEFTGYGEMYLSSSDLELFSDGGDEQVVGIRFRDIEIPEGFEIVNTYIDFQADKDSDDGEIGYGFIRAELNANPAEFSDSDYDVSSRTTTNAVVPWTLTSWFEGDWYATPDLTPVLEEVMNLPGWSNGGDIVFILEGDNDHSDTDHEAEAGPGDVHLIIEVAQTTPLAFDCNNLGENTVTLERADNSGNIGSASAIVTVADTIKPVLSIQEVFELQLDANGLASLTAEQVDNGCTDNCGISALELSKTTFDCEDAGAQMITFTATDASGNARSQQVQVTVIDEVAPVVSEDASFSGNIGEEGEFILSVEALEGYFANDACGIESEALSKTVFTCEDIGSQMVTLTVTDSHGNSTEVDVTVELFEEVAPIALAQDIVIELDEEGSINISEDAFVLIDNGSYDNCSLLEGVATLSKNVFTCEDFGENSVTYTVADINDNTGSTEFTVTVVDPFAPEVEVQDIEIAITDDGANLSVEDIELFATDNCSIVSKTLSQDFFTCEDLGQHEVTLTVTDSYGNVTERTAIVTVVDAVAPVAAPAAYTVELGADGTAQIDAATIADVIGAASSDNCASALVHELSKLTYDCEDIGEQLVTYTVTDPANNSTSAPVTITVVDNVAPNAQALGLTLTLDANGEAFLTAEDVDNNSNDNCGIADRTLSKTYFNCEDAGQQVVTLTVTDNNGNTDTANFMVTVVDETAPSVEISEATIYLDAQGWAQLDVDQVFIGATDACGVEGAELSEWLFNCTDAGEKQVMVNVSDLAGNVTSVETQVLIADTLKPTLSIASLEVPISAEGMAEVTPSMLMNYADDNCAVAEIIVATPVFDCETVGTTQATEVMIIDVHGNTREITLDVVVVDNEAPVVSAQDVVLELDENGEAILTAELAEASAADNCGIAAATFSQEVFTCADLNTATSAVFTALDESGNTASATITVTVVDNMAPVIEAPEVISLCSNEPLNMDEVIASDNCSVQLYQLDGPAAGEFLEVGEYTAFFEAVDNSGNATEASVLIEVYEAPEVDLGEDILADDGTVITLDAGDFGPGHTYIWNTGASTQSIEVIAEGTQTFSVTVISPNGCRDTDQIVITNDPALGVEDIAFDNSIAVFPNPTTGAVAVSFTLNAPAKDLMVTVTDLAGKVVDQRNVPLARNGEQITLNLRDVANGTYIVNVRSDLMNVSQRIIKH
jgi:hypothetical protein